MNSITPGFVGLRLKQGREARGRTAVELSDFIGVTRQAISKYELGKQTPSEEVLNKISQFLDLPINYFCRQIDIHCPETKFYRSLASATKRARVSAERRYEWFREVIDYLSQYVELPELNFPSYDLPDDPSKIRKDEIEKIAIDARRFWKLGDGPISNVLWLLENNGALITRFNLESDKLDAFSHWSKMDNLPFIVLNNQKNSTVRSRFDACHELAHLLLHRNVSPKTFNTPEKFKLIEHQANLFAGAFLLPEISFSNDLSIPNLNAMKSLKPKWKVSIGVMIKRARQLHLISEKQESRLWINRTQRGWRTREPYDEIFDQENLRFTQRSFQLLLKEGLIHSDNIQTALGLSLNQIEDICDLPKNFLHQEDLKSSEPRIILKFKK